VIPLHSVRKQLHQTRTRTTSQWPLTPRSTAVFVVGHALVRNICRGFYRIAQAPKRLRLAWSWTRLAAAL
jgi:hypothetical protein